MIEAQIHSLRDSQVSKHRVVVLEDRYNEGYLPIWVGPVEGEVILAELQKQPHVITDQLLQTLQSQGIVLYIAINDYQNRVYYAQVVLKNNDEKVEIKARPSDAIAVAVRLDVPIYIDPKVMELVGEKPLTLWQRLQAFTSKRHKNDSS